MTSPPWNLRVMTWRSTPDAAQARARWARIPRNVAESMAFEREAVPLPTLTEWHLNPADPRTTGSTEPLPAPKDHPSGIARGTLTLERQIEQGLFDGRPLDDQLVRDLHRAICESVAPSLIGWRRTAVMVGNHIAPDWPLVPAMMRDYGRDLEARVAAHGLEPTARLIETLAFAEGRLLSIHPFVDYNGRATRVFLRLLLRRLELPPVRLAPDDDERADYLAALSAADRSDWGLLITVWMRRLSNTEGRPEQRDLANQRQLTPYPARAEPD